MVLPLATRYCVYIFVCNATKRLIGARGNMRITRKERRERARKNDFPVNGRRVSGRARE